MQKRIDYLNRKLEPVIDRMRGYPAFDVEGYKQLEAQKLHLQTEIDWLSQIADHLRLRIEADSFSEQFHQVAIRLTIAPLIIVSPLNKLVYSAEDTRVTRMNVIDVDRMSYQFVYSDDIVGRTPPQMIADQIMHSYTRQSKSLDDMMEGVRWANIALQYLDDVQRGGFGFTAIDFKMQHAAGLSNYILRYEGEELEVVDTAVENDDYLKHIRNMAKDYWPTTRKLIAFSLVEGRFNIDWKPFEAGLVTSK